MFRRLEDQPAPRRGIRPVALAVGGGILGGILFPPPGAAALAGCASDPADLAVIPLPLPFVAEAILADQRRGIRLMFDLDHDVKSLHPLDCQCQEIIDLSRTAALARLLDMDHNADRTRYPAPTRAKLAPPPRCCEARDLLRRQTVADLRTFETAGRTVDAREARGFLRWLKTAPGAECRAIWAAMVRAGLDFHAEELDPDW